MSRISRERCTTAAIIPRNRHPHRHSITWDYQPERIVLINFCGGGVSTISAKETFCHSHFRVRQPSYRFPFGRCPVVSENLRGQRGYRARSVRTRVCRIARQLSYGLKRASLFLTVGLPCRRGTSSSQALTRAIHIANCCYTSLSSNCFLARRMSSCMNKSSSMRASFFASARRPRARRRSSI